MARKNQIYIESIYAWNISTNLPQTGDSGNITLYTVKDGAVSPGAPTTNSVVEIDATNMPGYYWITLTAAEMNGDNILVSGISVTSNVQIQGSSISTEDIKTDTLQLITDVAAVKAETALIKTDTTQIISDVSTVDTVVDAIKVDTTQTISDVSAVKSETALIKTDTTQIVSDTGTIVPKLPSGAISGFSLDDIVDGVSVRTILGLAKGRVTNKFTYNEGTGQWILFQNDDVTQLAETLITDLGRTKVSVTSL